GEGDERDRQREQARHRQLARAHLGEAEREQRGEEAEHPERRMAEDLEDHRGILTVAVVPPDAFGAMLSEAAPPYTAASRSRTCARPTPLPLVAPLPNPRPE